ncbi:MAG: hypothetical protein JWO13_1088 [Acidobacteriales bacterium]|nr:hypothetical protein [Terriglobales bacterium]
MTEATIFVPARFCGPPTSGNGGYTCGLISAAMGSPAEVTLRKPIPIERNLQIHAKDGFPNNVLVKDGEELIAEAAPVSWNIDMPRASIDFAEAQEASEHSPAFKNHPFPTCFVCGPERVKGDGLRIFPGGLDKNGRKYFAASWVPDASLADGNGKVQDEIIWAALDCPTGFAGGFPWAGTLVTGRLGARVLAPVRAGEKCVLLSWATGVDGRKHHAEAVLLGEDGTLRAESKATWIKLG